MFIMREGVSHVSEEKSEEIKEKQNQQPKKDSGGE